MVDPCATRPPACLAAWHRLAATAPGGAGFDAFFATVRGTPRPSGAQAQAAIRRRLAGAACESHRREILVDPARHGWASVAMIPEICVSVRKYIGRHAIASRKSR